MSQLKPLKKRTRRMTVRVSAQVRGNLVIFWIESVTAVKKIANRIPPKMMNKTKKTCRNRYSIPPTISRIRIAEKTGFFDK